MDELPVSGPEILLIGKPNSGKSLLFNRLTGLNHKVANFPGVTVQVKSGAWNEFQLLDFPGSYSLNPLTQDEEVAVAKFRSELKKSQVALVLCVLDATSLERSLFFGLQALKLAQETDKKIIYILNMMDEIRDNGLSVDAAGLSRELGTPVIPVSAKTQAGLGELYKVVEENIRYPSESYPAVAGVTAKKLTQQYGPKSDVLIKKINRLDRIFLSTFFGGIIFLAIMLFLFQSIFAWAAPLMDLVEGAVTGSGNFVSSYMSEGILRDFVVEALFSGVGTFLVFVPQIFILTFIIGLMEDSGYLSRVAIICHRPLRFFGLTGKSFIPFLSGHACAIPAMYAARMIESPKKRMVTLLTIPLISCSARLPIYALFIAALIPANHYLGGLLSLQGLVFFSLFILGYVVALAVSSLYSHVIYKSKSDAPFVLELSPYRIPLLRPLLQRSVRSSWDFLYSAGPVIFVVVIVVWVLGYFPYGSGHLEESWLAAMGHWMEPVVRPFGLDWRYGVAILSSFIAREVFVGTLGTFYGLQSVGDNVNGLAERIRMEGVTVASGVALLVFYVVALQCVSTLATLRRETGSRWIPVGVFIFYTLLAYVLAYITYQLLV
jgi:ferrous iron transport protein B